MATLRFILLFGSVLFLVGASLVPDVERKPKVNCLLS